MALKVSSTSEPKSAAGALANTIREQGWAEIQVIGPKAVNQAVKAIAIARGYIAPSGVDLISIPSFTEVIIDGEEKTAIRFLVKPRYPISQYQKSRPAVGERESRAEAEVEAEGEGAGAEVEAEAEELGFGEEVEEGGETDIDNILNA